MRLPVGGRRSGVETAFLVAALLVIGSRAAVAKKLPVAVDDSAETTINVPLKIEVTANDYDPDGDPIALADLKPILKPPNHGRAEVVSSTTVLYSPEPDFSGEDSFRYRITDGDKGYASATVRVTVRKGSGVEEPLIAIDDVASTQEGQAVTINVTANDWSELGNFVIRLSRNPIPRSPSNGTATPTSTGVSVVYTPNPGFSGTDDFDYEVTDGVGNAARAKVTVTVVKADNNPVARDDTATTDEDVAILIDVLANDSDPNGDPIHLAGDNPVVEGPLHGTATKASPTSILYTPDANYFGTDSFRYRIADGNGNFASANVTVTVTEVNDKPVARDDAATTGRNLPVTINVVANDSDVDGDVLRLMPTPLATEPTNGTAIRASDTSMTYTPAEGFVGTDSFVYKVEDGRGKRDTATVTITVIAGENQPPVAADDEATTAEDSSIVLHVLANDFDPDGDTLALATNPILQLPKHGSALRQDDEALRYTPNADFYGTDSFTYLVLDNRGGSDSATVTVVVTEVNDFPVARDDSAVTGAGQAVMVTVTANDSDPDGDPVSLSLSPITRAPSHGSAEPFSTSRVVYTPEAGFTGTDSFEYEVTDGRGGTGRAVVLVAVLGEGNNPPVALADQGSTSQDTPVVLRVTANDFDPDGDAIRLDGANPIPAAPAHGSASAVDDQSVRYTPQPGFVGTDSFLYRITDGHGATASAAVTVNVAGSGGHPPIAADDSAVLYEDTSVILDVTANDSDPDGDVVSLVTGNPIPVPPSHGQAERVSATSIRYVPEPDYAGPDLLRYRITDGTGEKAEAYVTLTVRPVEDAPRAVDDQAETHVDTPVTVAVTDNDTDPDGDTIVLMAVVTPPSSGTAQSVGTGQVLYTPTPGFQGVDTFEYEIGDGKGNTDRAVVTVAVTNEPPEAVDDTASVRKGSRVVVEVLANDTDPDGDEIFLPDQPVVTAPSHGTARRQGTTDIRYTPDPGFEGSDSFVYEVVDAYGLGATASVAVTVSDELPPQISVVSPKKIVRGKVTTVHVTGANLDKATPFIATEKLHPDDPDRAFPFVTDFQVSANGRSMSVKVDATNTATDGYYNLILDAPAGLTADDLRVVPPDAPVVDLWTPSATTSDSIFMMVILGANLRNAQVRPTAPAMQVVGLDNTSDDYLSGLLWVPPGSNPGPWEIVVSRRGNEVRLPIRYEPETVGLKAVDLTERFAQELGEKPDLPSVYLEEFAPGPSFGDLQRGARELAELADPAQHGVRVPQKGIWCLGCGCTITRRFLDFYNIWSVPVDGKGNITDEILQGLRLGDLVRLKILTFTAFANVTAEFTFDLCSLTDFQVCLYGVTGFEIPAVGTEIFGVGGLAKEFFCCTGFGCSYEFEVQTHGRLDEFDLTGGPCTSITQDPLPPGQGIHYADTQLVECCSEDLQLHLRGNTFNGVYFASDYNVSGKFLSVVPEAFCAAPEPQLRLFLDANGDNDPTSGGSIPLRDLDDIERYLPCSDPDTLDSVPPDQLPQTVTVHAAYTVDDGPDKVQIVSPPTGVTAVTFKLKDTSKFSGQAMNWPPDPDALRNQPDFYFSNGQSSVTESFNTSHVASVTIACNDYGGYTTLEATPDGSNPLALELTIPKPQTNPQGYPLPAIGWSTSNDHVDTSNLTATEDQDADPSVSGPPPENVNGDGLTTFAEYRGFVVGGKHLRTHPNKKDIFIVTTVSEATLQLTKGLGLTEHLVRDDEFYTNPVSTSRDIRLINFHGDSEISPDGLSVLRVRAEASPPGDPNKLGETFGTLGELFASPESIIYPDRIKDSVRMAVNTKYTETALTRWVVAHEVAHAAHVCHRQEDDLGNPSGPACEDSAVIVPRARLPNKVYIMHSGTVFDKVKSSQNALPATEFHVNSVQQIRVH